MQIAGSTNRDEVVKALHSVKFDGVTGEISFDATGNLRSARITIFQVAGGKWKGVRTFAVK